MSTIFLRVIQKQANMDKKQKNRWNKHKTTTTYGYKRKSISLDVDAFLEME